MRLFSVVFLGLCLVGCGKSGPMQVPVTGKLTVDGKPVGGVIVQLVPKSDSVGSLTAVGTTNAEGAFSLSSTNGKPGVTKGKYKVILSYAPASSMTPEERSKSAKVGKGGKPPEVKLPFPKDWTKLETTPKEYVVNEKPAPLDLSL